MRLTMCNYSTNIGTLKPLSCNILTDDAYFANTLALTESFPLRVGSLWFGPILVQRRLYLCKTSYSSRHPVSGCSDPSHLVYIIHLLNATLEVRTHSVLVCPTDVWRLFAHELLRIATKA